MLRSALVVAVAVGVAPLAAQTGAPPSARPIGAADPRTGNTQQPPLHAKHWLAITGKPLSASAGAQIFTKGGNAVDAAAAMLAAGCTMWDTLGCGGETQALIYNPVTKKVIGINALGAAPTGATRQSPADSQPSARASARASASRRASVAESDAAAASPAGGAFRGAEQAQARTLRSTSTRARMEASPSERFAGS